MRENDVEFVTPVEEILTFHISSVKYDS